VMALVNRTPPDELDLIDEIDMPRPGDIPEPTKPPLPDPDPNELPIKDLPAPGAVDLTDRVHACALGIASLDSTIGL